MNSIRLNHVVFYVKDIHAMADFFTNVLGCKKTNEVLEGPEQSHMVFLSFGENHHDLALVQAPKGKPLEQIHHIALEVDNRYTLFALAAQMIENNIPIRRGPLVHGIEGGGTFYAGDSGHVSWFIDSPEIAIELFSQHSTLPPDAVFPPPWEKTITAFLQERQTIPIN